MRARRKGRKFRPNHIPSILRNRHRPCASNIRRRCKFLSGQRVGRGHGHPGQRNISRFDQSMQRSPGTGRYNRRRHGCTSRWARPLRSSSRSCCRGRSRCLRRSLLAHSTCRENHCNAERAKEPAPTPPRSNGGLGPRQPVRARSAAQASIRAHLLPLTLDKDRLIETTLQRYRVLAFV